MATIAYNHLKTPTNTKPGLASSFFFAPVSSFAEDGIKCPNATATTLAGLSEITTNHTFETGLGFVEVLTKPFKNTVTATAQGEQGSLSFKQTLTVTVLGSYAELHGSMSKLLNEPVIVLIKDADCKDGKYLQLGCDCLHTYVESMEFTTGTVGEGQKGYNITFSVPTDAVLLYSGTVTKQGSTP